jgi:hypothetical protein
MHADEVLAQRMPELLVDDMGEEGRLRRTRSVSAPANPAGQSTDANADVSASTPPRSLFGGFESTSQSGGSTRDSEGRSNGKVSIEGEAEGRKALKPSVGRCDFQLQEDFADMEWFGAFRAHFCYWKHDDLALFIARAVCGYDVLDGRNLA